MNAPSDSRRELDAMVVEIELTLTSIVQGVALFFLIDNARTVLPMRQSAFWPYVAVGLLVILIFWSRSVVHTLTLIRWPLEFGHNFFYIACALGESLLFTRLSNPRAWFAIGALYAAIVWLLFIYDLRLVRAREQDSAGESSNRLYALVTRDQRLNIGVLVPALFVLNLACAICIRTWPEFFTVRNGHVWLAAVQLLAFGIYLVYVLHFFRTLVPLISRARQEWHKGSNISEG
ncbi:MAG TPA: hypothetical protein DIT76_09240 [Spartobacteria bacterium]|nr:hypothetical protein [Spartobacteria bacterium]HCP92210.1 hypothetical protein [Spartobacteria bacterium]